MRSAVQMRVRHAAPAAPTDDKRWNIVETRMRRLGNRPDALIEALHSAQETFGFLDDATLRLRQRHPRRAALDRLRRRHVLPPLHAEAAG